MEKFYTPKVIAQMCGVTRQAITGILKKKKIEFAKTNASRVGDIIMPKKSAVWLLRHYGVDERLL